jgi:hypothetical protein
VPTIHESGVAAQLSKEYTQSPCIRAGSAWSFGIGLVRSGLGYSSEVIVRGSGGLGPEYASSEDVDFIAKYRARCRCGAVHYEVRADPVDAKLCHCRGCQVLHGAPMQWAAIFHKRDVRLTSGFDALRFFNDEAVCSERHQPCKLRCGACGTPIADEGRRMWLAFPALFDFGAPRSVPDAFKPSCHIFYGARVVDVDDALPKWSGHKDASTLL